MSSKEPGPRLGTLLRGELADAYEKRGHGRSDLVLHYSGKAKADFGLTGELEYLHFLHAESDPNVVSPDYAPLKKNIELVGKPLASPIHAVVKTPSGDVVWRRLVRELAIEDKAILDLEALVSCGRLANVTRIEAWSLDQLVASPARIRSAHRALSWISAARSWPLAEHKTAALMLLKKNRSATFEEIFSIGSGSQRALFAAAVLELAHAGAVRSDMDLVPLHGMTLFHRVEN